MLISATLSKPSSTVESVLGKPYTKIKITASSGAGGATYFAEFFTDKQVFHRHFSEKEAEDFIEEQAGKTFKSCIMRTEDEEITILANKKGKITRLSKKLAIKLKPKTETLSEKKKNYLIEEGSPVPFLVLLGVMNSEGKVISSKYDKFRQINRFLEFIDDILTDVTELKKAAGDQSPVRIADFGCGKSYLTFAVHYLLTEIRHIPCQIEGLDLKNLIFHTGNISDYSGENSPDIVITLHACDTATDFALKYACQRGAKAILSVPCCQHQINTQLQNLPADKKTALKASDFAPLLKYGLIRERFSALLTDALRGQWLEDQGYSVQLMEFIDMEHTPKNILIRTVRKAEQAGAGTGSAGDVRDTSRDHRAPSIVSALAVAPELFKS